VSLTLLPLLPLSCLCLYLCLCIRSPSAALIADAVHSLTDLVSDVMTLATVGWSLKPPSDRFPSGYGKVESLGSLGVSGILLGGGFMMGWTALAAICQQFFPGFAEAAANLGLLGHGHHHHGLGGVPSMNAAWLAGGSIVIKDWLYRASKMTCTHPISRATH
jgi:divalent metal cation (Fe/Co/Zn/Cd) transporter